MIDVIRNRCWRSFGYAIAAMVASLSISCPVWALEMKQAYVRLMPPNAPTTVIFGELYNDEEQAVNIVSAKLQGADRVEIHAHTHVEGMMRMRKLKKGLTLKKGDSLLLKSGGYHFMVFGFTPPEQQALPLKLTLLDARGKVYEFDVVMGNPSQEPQHNQGTPVVRTH